MTLGSDQKAKQGNDGAGEVAIPGQAAAEPLALMGRLEKSSNTNLAPALMQKS